MSCLWTQVVQVSTCVRNPLAVLECQLRDSSLFVSTLPVDSSTLGWLITIQDVVRMLVLVLLLLGIMSYPLFHPWVVEPSFLARVYQATWDPSDVEMRKLTRRARGNHA